MAVRNVRGVRNNFYIFVSKERNFPTCRKHCVYGAKLQRTEHRALANARAGDLCFLYVMDERTLYGVFEIEDRIFEDPTDIGWDGDWPHRFPIRLWDQYLGIIDKKTMPKLMTFFSREMVTINDTSELHRKYLNPLLYNEGIKLLNFFIRNCLRKNPKKHFPDFGSDPLRKPSLNARSLLTSDAKEYVLELYLLQNFNKLEEIVGSGINEVYNQIYGYQQRYLDILTIHRYDEILKATVLEIKTDPQNLDSGLEELAHYMYWVSDKITRDPAITFGILLTPLPAKPNVGLFEDKAKEKSEPFGIPAERISWVGYEIKGKELIFTPVC